MCIRDSLTGDPQQARADIEVLRSRAGASTPATITEQYIIDEWCRDCLLYTSYRTSLPGQRQIHEVQLPGFVNLPFADAADFNVFIPH